MKKLVAYMLGSFVATACFALSADVLLKFENGKSENRKIEMSELGEGVSRLSIPKSDLPADIKSVEIRPEFARAKVGDDGYMIMPTGALTKFGARKNGKLFANRCTMAFFGSKTPAGTYVGIVKGMPYSFSLTVLKKGDDYSQFVSYDFSNQKPYGDIVIDFKKLEGENADYSAMGREYRNYKLSTGAVKSIKEKIKDRPALEYCTIAPEVRIRLGWKPAPPTVIHQNLKNEPAMKIVVPFTRVGQIVEGLKNAGVDKAEFCLVGWNIRGHDGRYPQMFPVEPSLGGEQALRSLIKNTLADGYLMTCHTNSTDAYEIADCWDEEYIIKKRDGSLSINNTPWSGGQMYNVCWRRAQERFGAKDLAKVADLGFKGMHYIDVVSCVNARECLDPRHPVNPDEASLHMNKIFDYCNKTFGGSMSEGAYDHCFGYVDSILYISFILGRENPMIDRQIPIWQLAYHGIVLSSPGTYCTNYTIKDAKTRLKFIEFGGRPTFYIHSKFRTNGNNWMGDDDLRCTTDAELAQTVAKIAEGYEESKDLAYLQLEFMDSHSEIAPDVFSTKYSDGSEVVCNYSDKPFEYRGEIVKSLAYKLYRPTLVQRLVKLFK